MKFLLRLLTWWNVSTLNTAFFTWRHGVKVGEDDQGNIFYRSRDSKKRWVIFNGESQASRVSPDWHGWLHHTWDELPSEKPLARKDWEKPHLANMTGTPLAYAPQGSIKRAAPADRRDYEAWSPE